MKTAYRTLVLKYDLSRLPEAAEKIPVFLKVQEEFRRWVLGWTKSGGSLPPPEHNPLKYFAKTFLHGRKMLDWLGGLQKNGIKVKKIRPPLVFDAQLRLKSERDNSRGVFIDIPTMQVRIRKWGGGDTLVLPLAEKATEWILARVHEGGKLAMAVVWVGASRANRDTKLYVALIFRREVAPTQPRRLLIVDINALHNGLVWAVVEGERVVTKGVLRPNVSKILHLQKMANRLDSVCTERDEVCESAVTTRKRIWRILRSWEDEAVKKLVLLAIQYRAAIVADVPFNQSIEELKKGRYSPEKKILLNFGRLRRHLKGLAEWYGIPYREERLYSTMCPRCGAKMFEQNRRVRCRCGFEAHKDEVPAMWAQRRYSQLFSFSSTSDYLEWFNVNVAASIVFRKDPNSNRLYPLPSSYSISA
jgi:putative transposase